MTVLRVIASPASDRTVSTNSTDMFVTAADVCKGSLSQRNLMAAKAYPRNHRSRADHCLQLPSISHIHRLKVHMCDPCPTRVSRHRGQLQDLATEDMHPCHHGKRLCYFYHRYQVDLHRYNPNTLQRRKYHTVQSCNIRVPTTI